MIAEAVGQYAYGTAKNFLRRYRRVGKPEDQRAQAVLHAQAHNRAANDPRNAGVIAWCAFDYVPDQCVQRPQVSWRRRYLPDSQAWRDVLSVAGESVDQTRDRAELLLGHHIPEWRRRAGSLFELRSVGRIC